MLKRNLEPRVREALADTPVVYLAGGRQTGKSTLAQSLLQPSVTLDNLSILSAARRDPEGFLAGFASPTVIDEVQRAPELFLAIKQAVDTNRSPGRFLLTGLAGRGRSRRLS